jgi:FecR protein
MNHRARSEHFESTSAALWRAARVLASIAIAGWLAGCATEPVTAITLSGVVRAQRNVVTGTVPGDAMQLVRNGAAYHVTPDMVLQPGDALSTGPDTAAVVSYPGGARAYVYPNSKVRIGSIIDDIGQVFVKVKGIFKVKTSFVTAGSEGTQYWVNVKADDQVKVVVVEDVVSLSSNAGAWPAHGLRAGQQAVCRGTEPAVLGPADLADIQRETDWVKNMDRLVPVRTSVSPWVAVGIGAAILIPLILSDHDKPASTPSTNPNRTHQ